MFITNKNNQNYTETVIAVYSLVSNRYKNTARITELIELLKVAIGLDEFSIMDSTIIPVDWEIYIVNSYINWSSGKDINFSEIYESILTVFDFSKSEKLILDNCNIEERLWAIYLAILNPYLNINND